MKKTRILASVMALVMCLSAMPMSAFALEEATPGANEVDVSLTIGETWTVKIPKTIELDAESKSAEYSVEVSGNIAGTTKVNVAPDASFLLSQDGKDDVTASITQTKQTVFSSKIEDGSIATIAGSIAAPDATSGTWNGSFNFNIALEEVELITFSLEETNCSAEAGMTWAEWIESDLCKEDIGSFQLREDFVIYTAPGLEFDEGGMLGTNSDDISSAVKPTDQITNGIIYVPIGNN